MPMQMRHDIAEARQIDLVGLHDRLQSRLGGRDDINQVMTLGHRQVGHFAYMTVPDHPAKSRKSQSFSTADADNTTSIILPKDRATG